MKNVRCIKGVQSSLRRNFGRCGTKKTFQAIKMFHVNILLLINYFHEQNTESDNDDDNIILLYFSSLEV